MIAEEPPRSSLPQHNLPSFITIIEQPNPQHYSTAQVDEIHEVSQVKVIIKDNFHNCPMISLVILLRKGKNVYESGYKIYNICLKKFQEYVLFY